MIILALILALVLYSRWAIVHVHGNYNERPWFDQYENGDIIWYKGCRATVIDRKTVDMVIRRHLVGLLPWVKRRNRI
jgi:hypothetical protein